MGTPRTRARRVILRRGLAQSLGDQVADHRAIALLQIVGCAEDRNRTLSRFVDEPLEIRCALGLLQLGAISRAKVAPPARVVAEPATEVAAGRHVAQPGVDMRVLFLEPSRPQPVDEDPDAIVRLGWLVDATEANAHSAYLGTGGGAGGPIQIVLTFTNSWMPKSLSSRPNPLRFTPPKGSRGSDATSPLMNTDPASMRRAIS